MLFSLTKASAFLVLIAIAHATDGIGTITFIGTIAAKIQQQIIQKCETDLANTLVRAVDHSYTGRAYNQHLSYKEQKKEHCEDVKQQCCDLLKAYEAAGKSTPKIRTRAFKNRIRAQQNLENIIREQFLYTGPDSKPCTTPQKARDAWDLVDKAHLKRFTYSSRLLIRLKI